MWKRVKEREREAEIVLNWSHTPRLFQCDRVFENILWERQRRKRWRETLLLECIPLPSHPLCQADLWTKIKQRHAHYTNRWFNKIWLLSDSGCHTEYVACENLAHERLCIHNLPTWDKSCFLSCHRLSYTCFVLYGARDSITNLVQSSHRRVEAYMAYYNNNCNKDLYSVFPKIYSECFTSVIYGLNHQQPCTRITDMLTSKTH